MGGVVFVWAVMRASPGSERNHAVIMACADERGGTERNRAGTHQSVDERVRHHWHPRYRQRLSLYPRDCWKIACMLRMLLENNLACFECCQEFCLSCSAFSVLFTFIFSQSPSNVKQCVSWTVKQFFCLFVFYLWFDWSTLEKSGIALIWHSRLIWCLILTQPILARS